MKNINIGFIGFGNIAQAIYQGFMKTKALEPAQISACAAHYAPLKAKFEASGINIFETPKEVAEHSDLVVLAIKPHQLPDVVAPIKDILKGKIVVCLAAGYDYDKLSALLPETAIVCAIPNTAVAVAQGIFVVENKNSLNEEQMQLFEELFGQIALLEKVGTAQLHIGMVVAGCSPAFTAMYIEALADAGVKYGLQRKTAYQLAAKSIEGTAALFLESGASPSEMKDAVCSPGGTTIKGVASLEKEGFRGDVINAVDAIEQK
jgi:pyrroline-5-carboxylate reductase